MNARYEATEIDGRWYVLDHKHPEAAPAECKDEEDALLNARVRRRGVALSEIKTGLATEHTN